MNNLLFTDFVCNKLACFDVWFFAFPYEASIAHKLYYSYSHTVIRLTVGLRELFKTPTDSLPKKPKKHQELQSG